MPSVHCISRKLLKKNGLECLPWDIGSAPTEQQQTSVDAPTDLQLQHAQHLGGEDSIHQCIQELDTEMSDTIDRNQKLGSIVVDSSTTQQPQPHQECLHTSPIPTKSVEEAIDNELNEFRTSKKKKKKKKKKKHMSPIALRALAALNSDSDSSSEEEDMDIDKPAQKGLDAAEIENLATGGKDKREDTSSSRDTQIMIPSLPPLPVVPSPGYNVADDTAQLDIKGEMKNRDIPHVCSLSDEEDIKSTREPAKKKRRALDASGDNKKRIRVSFQQRLDELKAYKDLHGHTNVKKTDDNGLYKFCDNIRYAYNHPDKSSTMLVNEERVASLNALGFDLVMKEQVGIFHQRLEDLKAYKLKHGHLNLKREDNPSLYNFCINIRNSRKNNPTGMRGIKVTEERIASLDALGFDWTSKDKIAISFEQRLEDLKAFKLKHGHLNLKKKENPSLYNFCTNIRDARKNKSPGAKKMKVTEERIASLDTIGFDWDPRKKSRDQKELKKGEGAENRNIPHAYSSDKEEDLKSTKEPAKKRRRTIETSGGNKKSTKVSFQQRLDELKAYKDEHGHMNVKKSENKSLYDFCVSIRSARKNPSDNRVRVTKERIESLDALGFEWVQKIKDTSFEQRLDDLKVYKMKHGHLSLKRSDDPGLYDFCAGMRAARKTAGKSGMRKLTKERIASLDILGFEWVVRENANISFKQRLEDLTAYKLKYGHLNMKRSDNTSLYNFCVSIRAARKNPSNNRVRVTKERIESLDAIGFDWDPRKQSSG